MSPLATYLIESTICSGVLLAAYRLLLERRVKFGWCRYYLLISTLLAVIIPLMQIPVWAAEVIEEATPIVTAQVALPVAEVVPQTASWEWVFGIGYGVGVILILGSMVWQVMRIIALRRHAEIRTTPNFQLVITHHRIASFSFLRSIYLWAETTDEEREAILAHEASHIAHHHSVERIVMTSIKAILWWNPFVWISAQRLTEVEEFEADHDVLSGGYDLKQYMDALFRQLFGYSPEIANSLRDSLTKKRFKMMTTPLSGRHSLLRLAATLPALIGLIFAFSFTTRAAEIHTIDTTTTDLTPQVEQPKTEKVPTRTPAKTARQQTNSTPQKLQKATVTVMRLDDGNRSISSNNKVQGAIVKVANSSLGVTTNTQGVAVIEVAAGTILEVLYPNYEAQTLTVSDKQNEYAVLLRDKTAEPSETKLSALYTRDSVGVKHKPLIVIDGVTAPTIDQIDASEIETITVLKDASATALYGERAKYGVIVITSKTSKKQSNEQPAAQKERVNDKTKKSTPYLTAETMPSFRGGDLSNFREWVQAQIKYPAEAAAQQISGRVIATFNVEQDGQISDLTIFQSPHKLFSDEVLRIFASIPAGSWSPGMHRGKPVTIKFTLPITFDNTKSKQAQK